jgi:hypothetical protein
MNASCTRDAILEKVVLSKNGNYILDSLGGN